MASPDFILKPWPANSVAIVCGVPTGDYRGFTGFIFGTCRECRRQIIAKAVDVDHARKAYPETLMRLICCVCWRDVDQAAAVAIVHDFTGEIPPAAS